MLSIYRVCQGETERKGDVSKSTVDWPIRFITSPPAPTDHIMGSSPNSMQDTVITFGRRR